MLARVRSELHLLPAMGAPIALDVGPGGPYTSPPECRHPRPVTSRTAKPGGWRAISIVTERSPPIHPLVALSRKCR
jgi:hypothetical protein